VRAVWSENAMDSSQVSPGNMKTQSSCEKAAPELGYQRDNGSAEPV